MTGAFTAAAAAAAAAAARRHRCPPIIEVPWRFARPGLRHRPAAAIGLWFATRDGPGGLLGPTRSYAVRRCGQYNRSMLRGESRTAGALRNPSAVSREGGRCTPTRSPETLNSIVACDKEARQSTPKSGSGNLLAARFALHGARIVPQRPQMGVGLADFEGPRAQLNGPQHSSNIHFDAPFLRRD